MEIARGRVTDALDYLDLVQALISQDGIRPTPQVISDTAGLDLRPDPMSARTRGSPPHGGRSGSERRHAASWSRRTRQDRAAARGAKRADRRLEGLRDNGDMRSGVRVADEVHAVFEHIEPKGDRLPSWLDLTVPDDRFAASCLLLQSEHPGSDLYAATGDINLQTKLTAIGLPFVELP